MKMGKILFYRKTGGMELITSSRCPICMTPHNVDTECKLLNSPTAQLSVCDNGNIRCMCRKNGDITESDVARFCKLLECEIDLSRFAIEQKQRGS